MTMRLSPWLFSGALLCALSPLTWGQIPQDRAELCGSADHSIPVPRGITAASWFAGADLTIKLRDGSLKTLELDGPDGIRQVCPLSQDRLLVFGSVPGDGGYIIWILSEVDGSIENVFGARNPRVSPDQHYLVYRRRYPTVVEVVYEEYLLYDLTRGAAANQSPGTTPQSRPAPGRLVFPITANRARLDDLKVTPDQYHRFAAESFFWSPDSKFVVFADRAGGNTSVVVIDVAGKELPAYVHGLNPSDICLGDALGPELTAGARLSKVEFGTTSEDLPSVWAHFSFDTLSAPRGTTCTKAPLLHSGNLKRAAVEFHKPIKE